jgi:hypothetical protein
MSRAAHPVPQQVEWQFALTSQSAAGPLAGGAIQSIVLTSFPPVRWETVDRVSALPTWSFQVRDYVAAD